MANQTVLPPLERHEERNLDLESWPRKLTFDIFHGSPKPQWGITIRLNVSKARNLCRDRGWKYLHASTFLYTLTCNQYEPMRYRIREIVDEHQGPDKTSATSAKRAVVVVHERIHTSVTILRPDDETYGVVALNGSLSTSSSFANFSQYATRALDHFHNHTTGFNGSPRDDITHGSILPWIDFTSYEHADSIYSTMPSIPRFVFGKLVQDDPTTDTWSQAFCLHVHHGLMDGLHVSRFLAKLQENFDQAETLLDT